MVMNWSTRMWTGRTGNRALALCSIVVAVAVVLAPTVAAGSDYIGTPPSTVYEDPSISPQNMDYDRANQTFVAHPGWIADRLIHYYKFRMYTPATYPSRVVPGQTPDIPIGQLFLLSTNSDFSGIVAGQKPIILWHTADGEDYSDFVELVWANVASGYLANTYRSYGDLVDNGTALTNSGIYANLPVVPTGSHLQDPGGSGFAPIEPLMVWYRGVEVQTWVFETTSQAAADYFNPLTRSGAAAQPGSGYEITSASFVVGGRVSTIPIWHLNQYSYGVNPGVNNGGPWRGGERNVIGLDRGDAGYSPLWQVFWVSKVPVDYKADMASSNSQVTTENGFEVLMTPMYVNCPNVGPPHGGALNTQKATTFGRSQIGAGERAVIQGALVMESGVTVNVYVGGTQVASATTGMMGAYEFDITGDRLVDGANTVTVKDPNGVVLQTLTLTKSGIGLAGVVPIAIGVVAVIVVALLAVLVLQSRRRRRGGGLSAGEPTERSAERK